MGVMRLISAILVITKEICIYTLCKVTFLKHYGSFSSILKQRVEFPNNIIYTWLHAVKIHPIHYSENNAYPNCRSNS